MKIQPYITKLNKSPTFKKFISKNPNAYLAAGFFVLELDTKKIMHQLDYFIPTSKKMATFILDGKIQTKESEAANQTVPQKIDQKVNLDLDIIRGIVEDEMKNNTVTSKLNKIIAVLQTLDGKLVWNLNCITNDMGVIKVHLDDKTHSVLKFEKINLFDIVKKL